MQDMDLRQEIVEPYTGERRTYSEDEAASIDFIAIFRILYASRRTISLTALVMCLLFTAAAFLIKPSYTATASFVPPESSRSSSASLLAGQLSSVLGAGGLGGGPKSTGDLYVGILKSRSIASQMVERFKLRAVYKVKKESQAEKRLAEHSSFQVGLKDSIVSISFTDHDPVRARDIANGYLDALKAVSGGLALTESSQRRLFFEDRLARERDELANAEVALKQSQEKTGLIAPAGQTAVEIQAIAQLRAQITGDQVRLAAIRQGATDQNPDVVRLQSEIATLQSQLMRMEQGKDTGHFGQMSSAEVPERELEYIRKAREVKYHEALFEIISRQYEAARLDEANSPPLQVLDPAVVPDVKSAPFRLLYLLAGLAVGLLCGCMWALLNHDRALANTWARIRADR